MRSPRILIAVVVVVLGALVAPAPAVAVTGTFAATCVMSTGEQPPVTTQHTLTYEAHVPESVTPGTTIYPFFDIGYQVPPNVAFGAAGFDVTGATAVVRDITTHEADSSVHGALVLTATGPPGSTVEVTLGFVGAAGGAISSDVCTPDHRLVVASIPIGVPSVSVGDAAVVEGSSGTRSVHFAVALSHPASTPVTVGYATEDGTARAGSDYSARSGSVTVPAGAVTAVVAVPVRGDTRVESKENFRIRLRDPMGAALGRALGTGRIIDDDPEPGPRLSIGDASVTEGLIGTRSARFTVSLSSPATSAVAFHYATVDGSAVADGDYRSTQGDLVVQPGVTSVTLAVPVVTDAVREADEQFGVRISGVTGAVLGRANGVGTVIDDD